MSADGHDARGADRLSRLARAGLPTALCDGPFVWMVMSLVVIPALVQRPPKLGLRWWVQFVGHFPFVGLPIVAGIGQPPSEGEPAGRG